jgi:hypothetical protein
MILCVPPINPSRRQFSIGGLSLANVNLIEDALGLIEETRPSKSDEAKELRSKIHRSVERQLQPKAGKPKKKRRYPSSPNDAMHKRLPGSFESPG